MNPNQTPGVTTPPPMGGLPPQPMMPPPKSSGNGGVVIAVIVVIFLLAAGYFLMGKMGAKTTTVAPGTGTAGTVPSQQADAVDPNTVQGTSSDVNDIEADLNATDLKTITADLNAI